VSVGTLFDAEGVLGIIEVDRVGILDIDVGKNGDESLESDLTRFSVDLK
jgi:hypothetical protein